ncbi:MobP3 family relaxase [uncultured Ruminococcus sp.]|uniref:MobP3 family relaxase n=1 Tax=uncultured Ruminococcus sp. TaxID=165186 RepID=UPI00292FED67|nr:MobP3 family relaxase [uncultured Ruminococcus sp.]
MAKIIVSCRFQKSAKDMADLIRYMATREGVENGEKYNLATSKQHDLILSVVKHFPQSKKFLEYDDYYAMPTKENANEFLDAVAERYADRADELKGLVNYISNRPGVEKLGSHGLFTQFDLPIDLNTVAERVANHEGVIWTEVVSLRREDAERLHFNNAEAWKNLVRRNMNEIAQAHRIKVEDLEWYGAFHNTTHHPHIHLVILSKGQEGFLSEKGIKELRRAFGQDIFRDEQYKLATIETGYRNELKDNLADLLQQIQMRQSIPNADYYLFLLRKIKDELQQQKGKKLYGYLPRKMKRLVDFALREFAKDSDLSEIYSKWNEVNREKLSLYYDTKDKPDVPIEKNPEMRSLKNMLMRTALGMNFNAAVAVNTARLGFLFSMLAKEIVNSGGKRLDELSKLMPLSDGKERSKIREKKLAHGQKEGSDTTGNREEVYDSQAVEGILTMLDYLISLGDQDNVQDTEKQNSRTEYDFDFDTAYAEYLNDGDDYDEDDDLDDDEQHFGLSM